MGGAWLGLGVAALVSGLSLSDTEEDRMMVPSFTCGDSNPQKILNSVMCNVVQNFPLASSEGVKYNRVRRFHESKTTKTIGLLEARKDSTKAMHSFFDITNFKPADETSNGAWLIDVMATALAEVMGKPVDTVHAKNVQLPLPGADSPPGFTNLVSCNGARVTSHAYEDVGMVAIDVYGPCDAQLVSEKICEAIETEKGGHVSRMHVVSRLDANAYFLG
mgnify:CR=1 FL=1